MDGAWREGYGTVGARVRRARGVRVPGEVFLALAQFAGQTVAAAAVTDVWELVRGRFARAAGVIHGDVAPPGPTIPGPARS
jgi:hypothetical protein